MRILLFTPFACSGGHHETDLEVASEHLNRGDDVHVIHCKRELDSCLPNPDHRLEMCLSCYPLAQKSFKTIGLPPGNLHKLNLLRSDRIELNEKFKNVDDLINYTWNGIEVGRNVATSLITLTYDTDPDMVKHDAFIRGEIIGFIQTYQSIVRYLSTLKPDLFYVFNGRATHLNAAFVAAQNCGVETIVGERFVFYKYILIPNDVGISIEFAKADIERAKVRFPSTPDAADLAHEWFLTNRNGNKEQLCNYLLSQTVGSLPPNWDPKKKNIGIFTSSEFESAGIRGWEMPYFKDQYEAITFILDQITSEDIHFYVRCHPNLSGRNTNQMRSLSKLKRPNLTILDPESAVDSYALLEAVDTVLGFGSTIGIEATYWGKPNILLGHAFWEDLGAAYIPKDKADLLELIKKDLKPLPRETVLPYGFWVKSRGQPFRFISPANPVTGTPTEINNAQVTPPEWALATIRWKNRFRRLFNFIRFGTAEVT